MKSDNKNIYYISKNDVLLVIHQTSGRWCSVTISETFVDPVPEGVWNHVSFPLSNKLKEDFINEVFPALQLSDVSTFKDGRSIEDLLIKCTSSCNYNCTYCYDHDDMDSVRSRNLDEEKVYPLIKECIEGASGHFTLIFHGGEPLIRKNFIMNVTKYSKKIADEVGININFTMQTHGGMFTDKIVGFLQQYNFSVGISIDGPEYINDKFRILSDGSGTYHKFKEGYLKYGSFMRAQCGILSVATSFSVPNLLGVARHFRDMGFLGWNLTEYTPVGRAEGDQDLEADFEGYYGSLLKIVDAIEEGEFNNFPIHPIMSHLTNLLSDERPDMCKPGNNSCGAGRRFLSVESDGTVLPCDILSRKDFTIGHISTDGLKNLLGNKNSTIITNSLPRVSCQNCALLGVCGGTCLGLSSLKDNNSMLCRTYTDIYPELMSRMHKSDKLLNYFDGCIEHEKDLSKFSYTGAIA